jgi:hypothetical protein
MKNKIIGFVLAIALIVPSLSFAQTTSYVGVPDSILQQLINLLIQEIQNLEQQLLALNGTNSTTTGIAITTTTATTTATITANGSAGSITVAYNAPVEIKWSSTNASSCSVSPLKISGLFGTSGNINVTNSQTYTVLCNGINEASSSVFVNVLPNQQTPVIQQQTIQTGKSTAPIETTTPTAPATLPANYLWFLDHGSVVGTTDGGLHHLRTDDPVTCPALTYATTTQNMDLIDKFSRVITRVDTFNGKPLKSLNNWDSVAQHFNEFRVNLGEQITVTGDFTSLYCIKYKPMPMGKQWFPEYTSTSTYTFTIPTSSDNNGEWVGEYLYIPYIGQFFVTSSTDDITQ